jgi:hypothetical protein
MERRIINRKVGRGHKKSVNEANQLMDKVVGNAHNT